VKVQISIANTAPLIWSFEIGDPNYSPISSYAISADGNYIAVGTSSTEEAERALFLFSKESNNWLWKFPAETYGITSLDISADGTYLVAYDHWNAIHLFHKNSSTPIWSFTPENYIGNVKISRDGEYIVASEGGGVVGETRKLYLFHRSSSTPIWTANFAAGGGGPVSISYDGSYIVLGGAQFYLFHNSSNIPLWSTENGGDVSISTDGSYMTVTGGGEYPYFYLFHKSSSTPLWSIEIPASATISGDGNYLAVAGLSYTGGPKGFLLFQRDSNVPQWSYDTDYAPDYSISISDDGRYIVGTENNILYLFNTDNNNPLLIYGNEPYINERKEFKSAKISGNGSYIVAAENNSISLLNVSFILPVEVWVDKNFCENCSNNGHSWGFDAFADIQSGIDVLLGGGTVHVAPGTYLESGVSTGSSEDYALIIYRHNVKLIGEERDSTIIDSDHDANRILITSDYCEVKGFTIKNSGIIFNGINMYNADNCIISGNKIINNGTGLKLAWSSNNLIQNNLVYNNTWTGIADQDSQSNIIADNIISSNDWSGISSNSENEHIRNNLISHNGTGIRSEYTSGSIYTNNTIVSNDLGLYSYNSTINILNSIIYDNGAEIDSQGSPESYSITYSNIKGGWVGEGNIDINPYFVNMENDDYRLMNYSPCVGAGNAEGAPDTDIDGISRPNPFGSNPDLGAYENSNAVPEIPKAEDIFNIFGMELNNQWTYEGTSQSLPYLVEREIVDIDVGTFPVPVYVYEIKENGNVVGREFYENTGDQIKLWGTTIEDEGSFYTIYFSEGLKAAWYPMVVGDHEFSTALTDILGLPFDVSLEVDVVGKETIILNFDTLEAFKVQYQFRIWGDDIDATDTFTWWIAPYLGVVKEQRVGDIGKLTSFALGGGSFNQPGDKDEDGLSDYEEFFKFHTHWLMADSDLDGIKDAEEIKCGADPVDPISGCIRGLPWLMLLLD
jgi:parallel beta-helix repeat protein